MRNALVFVCLLSAATSAVAQVSTTLIHEVTPSTPTSTPPPCSISSVAATYAGGYGTQSGWLDFTCAPGYTGSVTVTLSLAPYSTSTTVTLLPYKKVSDSWPKSYRNANCYYYPGIGYVCPSGQQLYSYVYAPSVGSLYAQFTGNGCYRAVATLQWSRSYYDRGSQIAYTGWIGACSF